MPRFFCALLLLCGCAQRAAPPSADEQQPFPDLSGRSVFVLPVQSATPPVAARAGARPPSALNAEGRALLEAELSYWLQESAPRVRWTLPEAVERAAQRSTMLDVRVRELIVTDFLGARLTSIGDPLYGDLRKVAVLLDVRPALLPIGAVWVPEADGTGRVQLMFAIIDTTGGAVVWSGMVAGEPGARADNATIASTARAVAKLVAR